MASVALSLVLLGTCAVPLVAASSEGDESKVLMDAIRAHRVVKVKPDPCDAGERGAAARGLGYMPVDPF